MKHLGVLLLVGLLAFALVGSVGAQSATSEDLEAIVKSLDSAVVNLRKGAGVSTPLNNARTVYENKFSSEVASKDNQLNSQILSSFTSVSQSPSEENIFELKSNVVKAAGLLGISVSPLYSYSIFIIAGITFILSLLITLFNKRVVNWEMVNRYKAEISQFMKEYREVLRRQDRKRIHKLEPRMKEIQKMQGVVMSQTMKPTLYYFIPLIILWYTLAGIFKGWVVAWLPFSINLPIYGQWVACGFGWWYLLTFFAFSTILRGILIPEGRPITPTPPSQGGE